MTVIVCHCKPIIKIISFTAFELARLMLILCMYNYRKRENMKKLIESIKTVLSEIRHGIDTYIVIQRYFRSVRRNGNG